MVSLSSAIELLVSWSKLVLYLRLTQYQCAGVNRVDPNTKIHLWYEKCRV